MNSNGFNKKTGNDVMDQNYLEHNPGHELRMWLLIGQEFTNHFVHDILWREEVREEGG